MAQHEDYQVKEEVGTAQETNHEAYWLKKLSGDLVRSNFHYDYKETVSNVHIIDNVEFRFSGEVFKKLLEFCGGSDLKLYEVLVASLTVLLHKHSYSGSKDIIVGAPVLQQEIGMRPVNTILALRNEIEDNMTFKQLMLKVGQTIIEAHEHKDFPIEDLPEGLNMPVFGDDFPLFDIALSLENIHNKRHLRQFNVNMIFAFFASHKHMEGAVEYNSSLFERGTVKQITVHLTNLLREVLSNIDIKVSDIGILSEDEKKYLLYELNDTQADYPTDKTIPQLFEEQVEKHHTKEALVFNEEHINYDDLNQKANQLARSLRARGVTPDSVVPILLDRSIQLVTAILGILKAGAGYLPIVVDTPKDRIHGVLEDSDVKLSISDNEFSGIVDFDGQVIDINDESLYRGDRRNPEVMNPPEGLVYVIYTSGSTGKPKGVMLEQRNLINLMFFQFRETNIDFSGRVLQFASVGFDVSAQEIFSTLLGGGTLYLTTTEIKLDVPRLFEYAERHDINIFFMPPAFLNFVFSNPEIVNKIPASVKHIIAAGEALTVSDAFASFLKKNGVYLHNHYGPTESHVVTTLTIDPAGDIPEAPSIGKSITNNRMMILGRDNKNLQPLGIPGELYLCGVNVARGYSNRPDMTDDRFLENPYVEGERMYKTGDLARWLPDGNIDFLGRIDFQVKIRGFRIEIGEIENQIIKQEEQAIKETIVLAREDAGSEKYLCAYIVSEKKVEISALGNELGKNLPDYMIPAYFVQIDKMPLTPNGKVDRKALPDPRTIKRKETYVAPKGEIEEKLVEIWSKVLHMEKDLISVEEDFFKLGGHSLKAAVMITQIHKVLDVKIVMHQIFDMPTVRKLAGHIKDATKDEYKSIPRAAEKKYYPQSSAQKRMFFMGEMDKYSTLYNIQLMDVYCKGVDKDSLEQAFIKLIERHESLRTSFHMVEGEAVQKIHNADEVDFKLEYYETDENGRISSDEPGKEWTQVTGIPFQDVVEHFVRPFDLGKPQILRAGLIKVMGTIQILMLDMHHIISDGVSLVVLLEDLWGLYEGKDLAPLSIQYKDFAEWSLREEQKAEIKKQEAFWIKEFDGEISLLTLPFDYPRPPKLSFDGDTQHFDIGKEETQTLNKIAQEQGGTLYMVLLSVTNVLLAKLSGQEDVIVGSVTAGRNHADIQDIIGMFVNTLVLRNFPESKKTFKEFLKDVKEKILAAFENQDYPFEELVSKVASRQDTSRNPLFDVVFGLENEADLAEYLLEVLMLDKSNPYDFNVKKSKFDMTFMGAETPEGLQFSLEYNTTLFKEETIQRFITYYKKIVTSVCGDIDQRISEIDIMPEEEMIIVLYDFNNTETSYPRDKTIHELFVEQAAKTPDNIAVGFYDPDTDTATTINYRDLSRKVNQLAHVLQTKGVTSGSIVGMLAKKSIEIVIGILGTLKAGGAYLPLNPDYPIERKKYIMDDCNTQLLLTNFEDPGDFASVVIGLDDPDIYQNPEEFSRDYSNDQLAYIMYTSGSTGKPKGVMVTHRNVVRLVKNTNFYPFAEDHKILQTGALEFDASTFEIWGCLLNGAAFYLVSKDTILNPGKLKDALNRNGITTIWMTSALFNQMLDTDPDIFSSLKYLLTGGDIVSSIHVERLKQHVPGIKVINGYGPTENTTFSATHPIIKAYEKSIPIGSPIANSTCYILDEGFHPVPIGVPGELFVGGDGVSWGYLNNPEMTQGKFFPDPFAHRESEEEEAIMYATGDLTRWLPDGTIEFMGRRDHQVKIRGFRIELGEIENQLLSYKGIKEAVVIAREDSPGQKLLCAYFSAEDTIDISTLRNTMGVNLPAYMMPSYIIEVEKLPLTSNGKVDRRRLPEPEIKGAEESYVAPSNENEEILADVWAEVLGLERVGIDDNFFEIGGDSIKTILISARLLKRRLSINIDDIFTFPTVGELAKNVRKMERVIDQGTVSGDVEITPIQKWFLENHLPYGGHFNQSVLFYRKEGFDKEIVEKVFKKIASHHDALRMVYKLEEKNVVQKNQRIDGALFHLEVIPVTEKGKEALTETIKRESNRIQRSIELKTGPLVKLGLFKGPGGKGDHLLVVIHHLVVDGVSWRILVEDFEIGYQQAGKGEEIKFQDKTDSFQYWAQKLTEYAGSKTLLDELPLWQKIEETGVEVLPVDFKITGNERRFEHNDIVPMVLNEEKTGQLMSSVNWTYNTEINDILLAAVGLTFKQWAGMDKVMVNLEGHGRENILKDVNIDRTVGWFTTQYPVVLDMVQPDDLPFSIRNVKETLRRIPNKGIGHGILKYLTPPEKKKSVRFKQVPEIIFNYLGEFGVESYDVIDTMSEISDPQTGDSIAPEYKNNYKIDIEGVTVDGKLNLYFYYHKNEYKKETIEKLAERLKTNLEKVIGHCVEKKEEIQDLGMTSMDYHIKKDYEAYMEKVKTEEWPDLTAKKDYRHILLTGATGFMGSHLVSELIKETKATLYMPVRGATQEAVEDRFKNKMVFYFGNEFYNTHKERLVPLRSNWSEEHMGIDYVHYEKIRETVEAILHPAANVKHHGLYEDLHRDNVIGTERLLELAVTGKKKDFYYVSTDSVGQGHIPGKEYHLYTELCHDVGQTTEHIYIKSKFEAEKRVLAYREKGVNASILRVGNLIFRTDTGKFQENIGDDFFYAIIKGVVKLGMVTENMKKIVIDMSFIDYITRSAVLLMTRSHLKNETYHLCNPYVLSMMDMVKFLRELGIDIKELKEDEEEDYLSRFKGNAEYEEIIERVKFHSWIFEEHEGTIPVYKIDRTVMLLEKLGFQWPETNKQHIDKMITYCKDVGFI